MSTRAALLIMLCACREAPIPSGQNALIGFESLSEGQTLTRVDDALPGLDGVQLDIALSVSNGQADTLELQVGGQRFVGSVSEGRALFTQMTLPFGEVSVAAQVGDARSEVHVLVLDEGAACAFVAPADGELLHAAETVLAVQCEGIAAGEEVTLGIEGRRQSRVPLDTAGRASVQSLKLAEGANVLQLFHASLGGPRKIGVAVDTGRCLAALAPADGTVFLHEPERDGPLGTNTPTRQLRFETSCAIDSPVMLVLNDARYRDDFLCPPRPPVIYTAKVAPLDGGAQGALFDAALMSDAQSARASVSEIGGRIGEALDAAYVADAMPPAVLAFAPENGSVVQAQQVAVRVSVVGVEPGVTQRLLVTGPNGESTEYESLARGDTIGCDVYDNGVAEWTITPPDGPTELLATIADRAGNVVSSSASVFFIATPPQLRIVSPLSGTLLTSQDDLDPVVPGLQVDVSIEAEGMIAGSEGTLSVPGQAPTFFSFATSLQTVRVTLEDGERSGIIASAVLLSHSRVSSQAIDLSVDATAPFLLVTAPRDGDLTPALVTIEAQLEGEPNARDWRVFIGDALVGEATLPASASAQVFVALDVMLEGGANHVRVEVDDRQGAKKNTSAQTLTLFNSSGPPVISWVSADASGQDVAAIFDLVNAPGPVLVDLAVSDTSATEPDGTSARWGRYLRVLPASGHAQAELSFSLFAHESARVWARATRANDGAVSAWVSRDFTLEPPTPPMPLRITSPFEGERLGGATLAVSARTSAGAKTCVLVIDGADVATTSDAAATIAFVVSSAGLGNGAHSLLVRCDAGAGAAISQTVHIDFRATTPTLAFIDSAGVALASAPGFINALALDGSSAAGFQHDLAISAEAPDGAIVSLDVTKQSDASVLAHATAPVLDGRATFRNVTLSSSVAPDGEAITLALAYSDAAFGTLSLTRLATIDRVAPSVVLTECPASVPRFNSFDLSATYGVIEWRATYTTQGVADGAPIDTQVTVPAGVSTFSSPVSASAATTPIGFRVPSVQAPFAASYRGSAKDAAGNVGLSAVCATQVDPSVAVLSFRTQRVSFFDPPGSDPFTPVTLTATQDDESAAAGLQVSVLVTLLNIAPGTTVRLCSTSPDASLASAPACANVPGKALASAPSVATSDGVSQVVFTNVTLSDSGGVPYGLAAEAGVGTTPRQDGPRSYPVIVDSLLPRATSAFSTPENIVQNDAGTTMQLGAKVWDGALYRAEGTIGAASIRPSALVFALGASGASVNGATLSSSLQGAVFGAASIDATSVRFTPPALVEGTHVLTLTLSSPSGNLRRETHTLLVDVTPPVILVAQPAQSPYTCETPGACTSPLGRSVDVSMAASDTRDMAGGCLCARTGPEPCSRSFPSCAQGTALGSGNAASVDSSLVLAEGKSQVVGEATDAAGNVTFAAAVAYEVDTLATLGAPVLTLYSGDCASFAVSGCELPFDQGPSACRDNGADPGSASAPLCPHWFVSGVFALSTSGTQTIACQASGDDCRYGLRLLSEPLDTAGAPLGAPSEVYASAKAGIMEDLESVLIETLPPSGAAGLAHAAFFRLVLEVHDQWGNIARSPARYVELPGFSGATVQLARGFDAAPSSPHVGLALRNGDALGVRHNTTAPSSGNTFTTDLRVELAWNALPRPAAPRCVRLVVQNASSAVVQVLDAQSVENAAVNEAVRFFSVAMPVDQAPYTVRATLFQNASCASAVIGVAEVSGITIANTLPTVAFNRAWLEAARFNSVGDGLGNTPATLVRAIKGPGIEALGLLIDAGSAPGFQFGVARPLTLDVSGALNGTAQVGTASVAIASSSVVFSPNLTLETQVSAGMPATTDTQAITARVCSRAGDCVSSLPLHMQINVDPPQTVSDTVVCTGRDDDAACAGICGGGACDARAGKAVLRFTAPGVAQSSVGTVSSYAVAVAILDSADGAECDALVQSGTSDPASLYVPLGAHTIAAPGAIQSVAVSGVPVHQRLCFAVLARDDVGNTSSPSSRVRDNVLVPLSGSAQPFSRVGADRPDDSLSPSDRISASPGATVLSAVSVGDMDGDSLPEIAVATDQGEVRLYSSKRPGVPAEIITAPPPETASAQQFGGASFLGGEAIAGGDFNGDGYADIALSSSTGRAPNGIRSGTVYVYFGGGSPLLQRASCGFATVPSPLCPHVVIFGGSSAVEPFFGSLGFLGWELRAGRVRNATGPDDLVLADPAAFAEQGGVYVIHGGGALFPTTPPATTQLLDLRAPGALASQVSTLGPFSGCGPDKFELSLALADLDGDAIQDIAVSYGNGLFSGGSCGLVAELLFFKGGALAATAQRCDEIPVANIANMRNIGPLAGDGKDWLIARSDSRVRYFAGDEAFFSGASTCTAGRAQPLVALRPIQRFGASLDDSCNATGKTHVLGSDADIFHFSGSAAPAGDWNGDGANDFYVAESSPRSRVYVVTRASSGCVAPSPPFRVIGELSGNDTSGGEGFGVHLFNAAGIFGTAGRVGGGSDDLALWLLR